MKYTSPSFSVPASGKSPENCQHGWVAKDRCVLCGEPMRVTPYEHETTGQVTLERISPVYTTTETYPIWGAPCE